MQLQHLNSQLPKCSFNAMLWQAWRHQCKYLLQIITSHKSTTYTKEKNYTILMLTQLSPLYVTSLVIIVCYSINDRMMHCTAQNMNN